MKTALQELIELIENGETRLDLIENHKQIWLEKEKKQIIDAYNHNMTGFDKLEQEEIGLNWAEEYYNQTYN